MKANLEIFSSTLQSLASVNRDVLVVTSDSRGSGKLVPFGEQFPDQIVEVGIAEQNLVGVAAGLASMGKITFAVSPACFLTARSLEQIKNDVAYSDNPVVLVGISAGVSYGALGSTHHSLHDYAVLRAIHNLIVAAPADDHETIALINEAAALRQPIYLRFGKKPMLSLPKLDEIQFGKARVIQKGEDIVLMGIGETVWPCFEAAALLEKIGVSVEVVSMHTIKPLDTTYINDAAERGKIIVTVEEHSVHGGLGEAVGSHLMQSGLFVPFKMMGFPDESTVTGSQQEIFKHYGISAEGIQQQALQLLNL